ncbi:hypothetical protein FA15DRAFT_667799 [Coprinopsis marcescibilis]|uniref:Uncharacterized protein n=1 Tax=Coprinopsis marcescibilis TaxID=230819 RepID=A0A5C3KZH8_COPMA|nr:hypothetical protein FA15DRAFT_667799 [Coprinopsis marcescibilis]
MAILFPLNMPQMPPRKRARRSATAVMAGGFDPRPPRDVLTSLLNGVGPYKEVEKDAEEKRLRKKERKEKKKARALELAAAEASNPILRTSLPNAPSTSTSITVPPVNARASSFWKSKGPTVPKARPEIMIASTQRSVSVTPPPMFSPEQTPECTPGPSISSSSVSQGYFKRPYTPDDFEDVDYRHISAPEERPKRERKKRQAARKGWKGWVEGSPPPSEKLINLDAVPVLQERRTRSGKNFDAIGVGKEGWV